jgi:DNA-binding beta-propeller fold protein YncE
LSHLATAALLLAALAASLYATGIWRFPRQEPSPAFTIEAPATPRATPEGSPRARTAPVQFVWRLEDAENAKLGLSPQIAVAPDGNLWVVDGARDGFQIVSPGGELIERWGKPGTDPGEFSFQRDVINGLSSVAFRPDGGFYVADSQNRRIQQFTADRGFVRAWGSFGQGDGQFVDPVGVLVDAAGNVYVMDDRRNDVQKFDGEGNYLLKFGGVGTAEGQFNTVGWGAVDAGGNLWIPDGGNDRVQRFAPDGSWQWSAGSSGQGDGELNNPQAVAVDAAGRLFVTDSENARVQVFAADGQFLFAFNGADAGGTAFRFPIGIALDKEGNSYVLDYHPEQNHQVLQKFRVVAPAP